MSRSRCTLIYSPHLLSFLFAPPTIPNQRDKHILEKRRRSRIPQPQIPQGPILLHSRHLAVMRVRGAVLCAVASSWDGVAEEHAEDFVGAGLGAGLIEGCEHCWLV